MAAGGHVGKAPHARCCSSGDSPPNALERRQRANDAFAQLVADDALLHRRAKALFRLSATDAQGGDATLLVTVWDRPELVGNNEARRQRSCSSTQAQRTHFREGQRYRLLGARAADYTSRGRVELNLGKRARAVPLGKHNSEASAEFEPRVALPLTDVADGLCGKRDENRARPADVLRSAVE